ncbi:uncharacterized protein LOC127802614 [Diospyros lotus]|uniref:uncharacterized protein LOC127802614 n=1 Tax=Diospyros lotus TaxID=55363 RepID=UPI00224D64B1|nr:uncharacterized protein LOC127802614 [Diospyros lotus]
MENYYAASYPDSGESSPRSREIDFENTPPWEDQAAAANANYRVKLMCSYGGKVHPRPHDNQLSYIGGETKILAVDRHIKFAGLIGKLSALCDADVCFKYQLPGEDLDALISVTNDDDLEHMMHEYDRSSRASSKPARLRLFLFPVNQTGPESFGSTEEKSDRDKFVEALNSAPIQSSPVPSTVAPPGNVDFLFGLDKGIPPQPTVSTKVHDLASDRGIPSEDRVMAADPIQQRQIQDFQRMQIGGQEQAMYPRKSDDNLSGGFPGDYYVHKLPEKVPPQTIQMSSPPGYWPEKHVAGGVYPVSAPVQEQQQVYMIQAPTGMYHAPMTRQVTGPPGQGYYAVQRMPPEVYRDQPSVYNVQQPPTAATAVASSTLPPQPLPKVGGFSEGIGMAGYTAMAYDSGAGRQVYYTAQGGAMATAPASYQGIPTAVSVEGRSAGAQTVDGKVTVKPPQGSM